MRHVASNTLPATTRERLLDASSLISRQMKYGGIVFYAIMDATYRIQKPRLLDANHLIQGQQIRTIGCDF